MCLGMFSNAEGLVLDQVPTTRLTTKRGLICKCLLEKLLCWATKYDPLHLIQRGRISVGPVILSQSAPSHQSASLSPQCGSHCALPSHQIKKEAIDHRIGHWPETRSYGGDSEESSGTTLQTEERFMRDEARKVCYFSSALSSWMNTADLLIPKPMDFKGQTVPQSIPVSSSATG